LANDRAIKFTTDPPDTFPGIAEDDRTADYSKMLLCPNPFRQIANIKFQIPRAKSQISLKIYDVGGRLIKNFELPTPYSLLPTSVSWNGTNDLGKKVATGVYFIRLETEGFYTIEKIVFLK